LEIITAKEASFLAEESDVAIQAGLKIISDEVKLVAGMRFGPS
jgi:hypothetical protein